MTDDELIALIRHTFLEAKFTVTGTMATRTRETWRAVLIAVRKELLKDRNP